VFAIFMQLTLLLTPIGYLLIGPLADQVFTPLASDPAWAEGILGTLFGGGAAGGMGVLFGATALFGLIAAVITFSLPSVRHMEETLPSYSSTADTPPAA
jgi:hypothetical protein